VPATTTPIVETTQTNTIIETSTSTKVVTSPYVKSKTITVRSVKFPRCSSN
jgi:hypothetical protein